MLPIRNIAIIGSIRLLGIIFRRMEAQSPPKRAPTPRNKLIFEIACARIFFLTLSYMKLVETSRNALHAVPPIIAGTRIKYNFEGERIQRIGLRGIINVSIEITLKFPYLSAIFPQRFRLKIEKKVPASMTII